MEEAANVHECSARIYDWTACRLVGFVDDVTMLVTPIMLEALLTAVTEAIGRIEAWLLSRGFYLAREKTETTFRNTKGVPRSFSFQYEEHEIVVVKSLRCLGIIFDQRRRFRQHMPRVTEKP